MGKVTHFDIAGLIRQYDLQYFVETGTGQGESLAAIIEYPFRAYYSCDWDEIMIIGSRYRMRDYPDVHIAHARSTEFLETLLSWLPRERPILFWLDAHFPGTAERDHNLRLPLATELDTIMRLRPEGRDVIAIDDLAIYIDGEFGLPLLEELRPWCPVNRDIDFVHAALGGTHRIECSDDDGGYLLAVPSQPRRPDER